MKQSQLTRPGDDDAEDGAVQMAIVCFILFRRVTLGCVSIYIIYIDDM